MAGFNLTPSEPEHFFANLSKLNNGIEKFLISYLKLPLDFNCIDLKEIVLADDTENLVKLV